jgi:LPS sulfotransferase NodH
MSALLLSGSTARPCAFVILATQRTGSNWLMGMLDAHPRITVYDELFLPRALGADYHGRTDMEFFHSYLRRHAPHAGASARARWALRYLRGVFVPPAAETAVGMKLMYGQLWKNPVLLPYLLARRARVVHLTRANLLDVVLSEQTAIARERFHANRGEQVDTAAVRLDTQWLHSTLRTLDFRVRTARRLLKALPLASIEIRYETLLADNPELARVLRFLGIDEAEAATGRSPFQKLNTRPRRELIVNHDEVAASLAESRFAHMLDEVAAGR